MRRSSTATPRAPDTADRPLAVTRWASIALLVAVSAVVLLATLWPTPIDRGYRRTISRFLGVLHDIGVPEWFAYAQFEFSANVVMFAPLGFLLVLALSGRRWWLAVVLPFAGSVSIEIIQGGLLHERYASAADVAANTLGALIGAALALGLRAVVHARDRAVAAERAVAAGTQVPVAPHSMNR